MQKPLAKAGGFLYTQKQPVFTLLFHRKEKEMIKRSACDEALPDVFGRVRDMRIEDVTLQDYRDLVAEYQALYAEQSKHLASAKALITKLHNERFAAVLRGSIP